MAPPSAPAPGGAGRAAASFAARSHVGHVRERNEDAYLLTPEIGLLAVFDGLGGHAAGDVASRTAAEHVSSSLSADDLQGDEGEVAALLEEVLHGAHRAVAEAAQSDRGSRGMATTAVLAVVRDDRAVVAHVGDSRAYVVGGTGAEQVTRDHGSGSFLTQALGLDRDVEPESTTVPLPPDGLLLLCTDGLTDMLTPRGITAVSASAGRDGEAVAEALVAAALDAGGIDNVTVAVALPG